MLLKLFKMASLLETLFVRLEEARIPLLDGVLDPLQQSIVAEIGFWLVAYAIFARVFSETFRAVYKKFSFWESVKLRSGTFAQNAQDDMIVLSILAIHHGFGGILMLLGTFKKDDMLWRHGYLVETGFECYDMIAMILYLFPYTEHLKPEIRAVMAFHHLPGIMLSIPILTSELGRNSHLHMIGGALLFAGAVSCAVGCFIHSRNFNTQVVQVSFAQTLGLAFYMVARFWIYPIEFYGIYQDLTSNGSSDFLVYSVLAGGFMMGVFNVVLLPDMFAKTFRHLRRIFDRSIKIETEPVPLSKEDRLKLKAKTN